MAHFWHYLGKAFCLRTVIMVLGDSDFHCRGRFFVRQNLQMILIAHLLPIKKEEVRKL